MDTKTIIKAIDAHANEFGMEATSIGQMAVKNRRIYENLKNGGDIQLKIANRLLDWIAADAARKRKKIEIA